MDLLLLIAIAVAQPQASRGDGSSPLVAQILDPEPEAKVWAQDRLRVRIRVLGDAGDLTWSLLLKEGSGLSTVITMGTGSVNDASVAELETDSLSPGQQYALHLTASRNREAAEAEVPFRVSSGLYTLIPLEEGNLSRSQYSTYSGDASGNVLLYSGEVLDPAVIILMDRRTGLRRTVRVPTFSNEGVTLSGDGRRLFYSGTFRTAIGTYDFGVGFIDLTSESAQLVGKDGHYLYSTDAAGDRVVYEGLTAARVSQYFFYDQPSGRTEQLTNDPRAVVHSTSFDFCPHIFGTRPLMAADGSLVLLITSATLGLTPDDESVGCRFFVYDVASHTLTYRASLQRSTTLSTSYLSADGRWVSFTVVRDLPNGVRRSFPALMNLETGELEDPVVDVGNFTSFDSAVTGDGLGVIVSTQADLDPRVGNTDRNLELFYYDRAAGTLAQISETIGGIGSQPGGCPPYRPYVSWDGAVLVVNGFHRFSVEGCNLDGPQRNQRDGFWFRVVRAVRKRSSNRRPVFDQPADAQVTAGNALTLAFAASDPDGDPISFFAQVKDGFDVPPGSEITDHHDGTATFTWPTRPEHAGEYILRVAAFDEGGGEVFHDITISVVPGDGPSPSATPTRTLAPMITPAAAAGACVGDCNRDGVVSVSELVTGVSIALDRMPLDRCPMVSCDSGNRVGVDCLVRGVNAALTGCPN